MFFVTMFTFFDHTGDIGVDVTADSAPSLFAEAGRALFEAIADTSNVETVTELDVTADGEDHAELLNRFLTKLLVLFETDRLLLPFIQVKKLTPRFVSATVAGERFNPKRHEGRTELKAVTWHELLVEKTDEGWKARVVFDV